MAIKIPSAAELGVGRRTPGAIAGGTPRPIPKIRTDIGLEIAQGLTQLAGTVVEIQRIKQEKAEKIRHDEAKNNALKTNMGLKAGIIRGSKEIEAREDLDFEGKDQEQEKLLAGIEGEFRDKIPQEFQSELSVDLRRIAEKDKLDYENTRAVQIKNKRVADAEMLLLEVETFSSEYPGNEKAAKEQARIIIDASPLSATDKVKRKKSIDSVIDLNTVNNELALGDPKALLDNLQEKTEGGAYANYRGLSSANRTKAIKQARDAVSVNRGFQIANDLWDKQGPEDKFDLIDVEDLTETARKRAGTEEAANAAVTRIRERATLHNQARNAKISSNETTIWEAHDNGAKSAAIYKMQEFVELPAENRLAIQKTLSSIAERTSKEETFALKMEQISRFEELNDDSAELRKVDLMAELRAKKITESQYNTLKGVLDKGSLESNQSTEAFNMLKQAKKDMKFNPDDETDNRRQYAAASDKIHDYILTNPNGDPITFADAILNPIELRFRERLSNLWFGSPGTEAMEARKAQLREELGLRADGTPKGRGFLGVLNRPDGGISTELSVGVEFDGKEIEIPTLIPTLNKEEIAHLLQGKEATEAIMQKAIVHAQERIAQGKSPFYESSVRPIKAPPKVGEILYGYRFLGGDEKQQESWEKVE